MKDKNNMFCDLETGICGSSGEQAMQFIHLSVPQKKNNVKTFASEQLEAANYRTKEILGQKYNKSIGK